MGVVLVDIAAGLVVLYGATHLAKRPRLGVEVVGYDADQPSPARARGYGDDRRRTDEAR